MEITVGPIHEFWILHRLSPTEGKPGSVTHPVVKIMVVLKIRSEVADGVCIRIGHPDIVAYHHALSRQFGRITGPEHSSRGTGRVDRERIVEQLEVLHVERRAAAADVA